MNPSLPPSAFGLGQADAATAAVPPHVAREAVQWWLDLRAKESAPSLHAQWSQWLAADPAHRLAWQRIDAVNQQLQPVSSPFASALAHAGLNGAAACTRCRAAKGLAAIVFGGGALWTIERHTPWREMTADLHTGVGKRLATTLADGSQAVLNTASALNLRFGAHARRLQLLAGEVLVTTAHDSSLPARPFLVETRHGQAHALGTQFTVRQYGHATRVAVFEGAVEIRPCHATGNPTLLRAGQQAVFTASGVEPPTPADQQTGTAWTQGTLIALSMPLGEFVQELGRYSDKALSCDPAVAGLRISGSYPTGNVDAALRSVAQALALQLVVVDRFWGPQAVRIAPAART